LPGLTAAAHIGNPNADDEPWQVLNVGVDRAPDYATAR
jgi:hypothetical protein